MPPSGPAALTLSWSQRRMARKTEQAARAALPAWPLARAPRTRIRRTAIRAHARIADDEGLHAEVAGIIAESGLSALLGLGIFARAPSVARATSVFLEETRFAERQSVVHVFPRLPRAPGRLIPTLWTWGTGGELVCETICQAYCSHPKTGIGYCGHTKDRHVGKT